MALPEGRPQGSAASGEGVWVLGLIRGSAADAAGLQQGDQLLELNGRQLAGESPFAVASLLQGPEQPAATQQGLGLEASPVQLKVSGGGGCRRRPCCWCWSASWRGLQGHRCCCRLLLLLTAAPTARPPHRSASLMAASSA